MLLLLLLLLALLPFKMCEIVVGFVTAVLVRSDWSSENGNQMLASRFGGDSNDGCVDEDAEADTDNDEDDVAIVSECVSLWSRVDVTPNPIS